jgi:sirohydrochlorin ferrochelatase
VKSAALGILLLAHGGDPSWNAEVERLRARVDAKVPTETALGMADIKTLQAAVERLEKRGVLRVVAVPLFVQTRSEVLDQTRYALGLAVEPSAVLKAAYEAVAAAHAGHGAHGGHPMTFSLERVKSQVLLVMSAALDDDELVAKILLERAKALSKDAARETVVFVAHGPYDDAAVVAWQGALERLAARVKAGGKFSAAYAAMLRDDSPAPVRASAVAALRKTVEAAGGRALVVPVLIARGGIEKKIEKDLAGLTYAWDGKTLMPHPGFDAWVLRRAQGARFDTPAR